jgi:hypothetical protein
MTLIVHGCEQGSPEWFAARAGKPTASEFATILAKGKDGGASVTRRTYLHKLAGEILTGEPMESYTNVHMERGKQQEANARDRYALLHDCEPELVGFMEDTDAHAGASPDSLIGTDGLLEIKTALPHILIEKIQRGTFPAEHVAQTQGALWITGRAWVDIAIHCPKLPMFVRRATRDEEYIARLAKAVREFNAELDEIVASIRRYGQPSTLRADLSASLAGAA